MKTLRSRLPTLQAALPVFGVFVFFGFSWALYRMFWYVPSWLEYLSYWKVLTIAAYVLAFGLVESLVMMGALVLFSLLFPERVFREKFILLGSSLAALISIGAVLLQRKINLVYRLEMWQVIGYTLGFLVSMILLTLAFSWIYKRFPWLGRLVGGIADRMTIFVYLYVPLSLVGWAVVLVRNLFGA